MFGRQRKPVSVIQKLPIYAIRKYIPMLPTFLQQVRKCSIKKRITSSSDNTTFTSQRSNSYKEELQAMPALLFCFSSGSVRSCFLLVLYCTDKKINLLSLSFLYKNKENSSATYWYNTKTYNKQIGSSGVG